MNTATEKTEAKKYAIVRFKEYEGNYIDSFEFCGDGNFPGEVDEFTASEAIEFLKSEVTYFQGVWLDEKFETVEDVPATYETYWHHTVYCVIPLKLVGWYSEYFEESLNEEEMACQLDCLPDPDNPEESTSNLSQPGWVKAVLKELVTYDELKAQAALEPEESEEE